MAWNYYVETFYDPPPPNWQGGAYSPGTGKTVTIVEAIKTLVELNPEHKILACAPSNAAADLIATRLVASLHARMSCETSQLEVHI